jgi:thymidylate synthase
MDLKSLQINATSLEDAWFQTIYACIEHGRDFKIDRGSFEGTRRLEFDYIPYLMTGELKEGESYTYGQRMCKYPIDEYWKHRLQHIAIDSPIVINEDEVWNNSSIIINEEDSHYVNQIELMIWTYKNKGFRNNQMVLQVAHPSDMLLKDPPCLRSIDTRIQDGKLHFIIYFRSWDLWGGFPANLAGIQMLKEYMASEIGVEDGEMICSSKGLHLYNYTWELAECIRGKTIEQFRSGK